MTALLTLLAIVLGPLCVTRGVLALLRSLSRRAGREAGAAVRPARPLGRPADLNRLVVQLSRLERERQALETTDAAGASGRLHELGLAYDDTLGACCACLGLPSPGRAPLPGVARLEVEAALAQRGFSW